VIKMQMHRSGWYWRWCCSLRPAGLGWGLAEEYHARTQLSLTCTMSVTLFYYIIHIMLSAGRLWFTREFERPPDALSLDNWYISCTCSRFTLSQKVKKKNLKQVLFYFMFQVEISNRRSHIHSLTTQNGSSSIQQMRCYYRRWWYLSIHI
jgi:hypothetical protein